MCAPAGTWASKCSDRSNVNDEYQAMVLSDCAGGVPSGADRGGGALRGPSTAAAPFTGGVLAGTGGTPVGMRGGGGTSE